MREGWRKVRVSDVAQVIGGGTPKTFHGTYWDGDIPWITPKDLSDRPALYTAEGSRSITEAGVKGSGAQWLPAGTVLLSTRAPIGYVTIAARPLTTNQGFKSLVLADGQLPEYWYYLLSGSTEYLRSRAPGSTFPELSKRAVEALEFALPPVQEQRRIVDLMSHMDAVVQATRGAHTAGLESYSALSKPLPLRAGQPRSLEEVLLSARAGGTPSRSRSDFYGGGIPWVKSGEVRGTVVRTQESLTPAGVNGSSAWVVPAGRVLVAMYGATAGQVGMLGIDAATNQAVLALEADPNLIHPRYLYHMLRGDTARLKVAASGAAQPNLSKTTIIQRSYPIPSLNEQTTIAEVLDGIEEQVERERITLEGLNTLRQITLSALVSGEHAIPTSYDEFIRDEGAA